MSKQRSLQQIARRVVARMGDGTYAEDMDLLSEDVEELCPAVLARRTASKRRA